MGVCLYTYLVQHVNQTYRMRCGALWEWYGIELASTSSTNTGKAYSSTNTSIYKIRPLRQICIHIHTRVPYEWIADTRERKPSAATIEFGFIRVYVHTSYTIYELPIRENARRHQQTIKLGMPRSRLCSLCILYDRDSVKEVRMRAGHHLFPFKAIFSNTNRRGNFAWMCSNKV